jgi:hypothetical protein
MLWAGCVAANRDPGAAAEQARLEIQVDAAALAAGSITRVSIESDGATADLAFSAATGSYDGSLLLTVGHHDMVASAFTGDDAIGRSQPAPVDIAAGVVTRVELKILDVRPADPSFGPIVDALSFPTSSAVGASSTFAISATSPAGDPLSYAWTTDCTDSTFGAPAAATTTWTKWSQGGCMVGVAVTSGGFTVERSFAVVVFPAGSATGAAGVSGTFVPAPKVRWALLPRYPGRHAGHRELQRHGRRQCVVPVHRGVARSGGL